MSMLITTAPFCNSIENAGAFPGFETLNNIPFLSIVRNSKFNSNVPVTRKYLPINNILRYKVFQLISFDLIFHFISWNE